MTDIYVSAISITPCLLDTNNINLKEINNPNKATQYSKNDEFKL